MVTSIEEMNMDKRHNFFPLFCFIDCYYYNTSQRHRGYMATTTTPYTHTSFHCSHNSNICWQCDISLWNLRLHLIFLCSSKLSRSSHSSPLSLICLIFIMPVFYKCHQPQSAYTPHRDMLSSSGCRSCGIYSIWQGQSQWIVLKSEPNKIQIRKMKKMNSSERNTCATNSNLRSNTKREREKKNKTRSSEFGFFLFSFILMASPFSLISID